MEVEIHIKGHKFVANSVEEVDQILKWFAVGKGAIQKPFNLKETSKKNTGLSMENWRRSKLLKRRTK
jgi:hypothetical protein